MNNIILPYILFEDGYLGNKFVGKEYKDVKTGDKRFYYKPEGVKVDDRDALVSCDEDKLENDKYFAEALNRKGPAAKFAWRCFYGWKTSSKKAEVRKKFLIQNSWYWPTTTFSIVDRETHKTMKAKIRISNHLPAEESWKQRTLSNNTACLNIMIGIDTTEPGLKEYPETVTLKFNTREEADEYNNHILKKLMRDITSGNTGTIKEKYELNDRYFIIPYVREERARFKKEPNKLETGFKSSDFRQMPNDYSAERIHNYFAKLYKTPDKKNVTVYYNPQQRTGFYFKDNSGNWKDKVAIKIIGESLTEAVQITPVYNVDTEEFVITEAYSKENLYRVGMQAFFDGISQLNLAKWNEFLQVASERANKKYVYPLKKYYVSIQTYMDELEENGDSTLKDAVIEIGRELMKAMLQRLSFNNKGEISAYKSYDVREIASDYYSYEWSIWNYGPVPEDLPGYAFISKAIVDISDVNWEMTANQMINFPDENVFYVENNPKVEMVVLADGKEFLI